MVMKCLTHFNLHFIAQLLTEKRLFIVLYLAFRLLHISKKLSPVYFCISLRFEKVSCKGRAQTTTFFGRN